MESVRPGRRGSAGLRLVLAAVAIVALTTSCASIGGGTRLAAVEPDPVTEPQPGTTSEPSGPRRTLIPRANSAYVLLPDPAQDFWREVMNPTIAYEYRAINGISRCTAYVADTLSEHFTPAVFDQVFPDGVLGANDTFIAWLENPNLIRLSPGRYSIADIQALADRGYLILMSYFYPEIAGHAAFVGHSGLRLYTIPAIRNLEGKRGNSLARNWLPVMVQAGTYTGVTSMVYATNGWLRNDNFGSGVVRYYVVKAP